MPRIFKPITSLSVAQRTVALLALLSAAGATGSYKLDASARSWLEANPMQANFVSGVMAVPATALVAFLAIEHWQSRAQQAELRRVSAAYARTLGHHLNQLSVYTMVLRRERAAEEEKADVASTGHVIDRLEEAQGELRVVTESLVALSRAAPSEEVVGLALLWGRLSRSWDSALVVLLADGPAAREGKDNSYRRQRAQRALWKVLTRLDEEAPKLAALVARLSGRSAELHWTTVGQAEQMKAESQRWVREQNELLR